MLGARTIYWPVLFLLFAVCGVVIFLKGALRWVRFLFLGTMIFGVFGFGFCYSWITSILAVILVLLVGGFASYYLTRIWSKEVKPAVAHAKFEPPDSILLECANSWMREGEPLGFRLEGEHILERKIFGEAKRSWLRVLKHTDRTTWAEIWVTMHPKVAWIRLVSCLEDGRVVESSSRLTLQAIFGDTQTEGRRIRKRTTIGAAYLAHQANLERAGGTPITIEDAFAMSLKTDREWGERLVEAGTLTRDGDVLRLEPKSARVIFLQTAKALLLG